VLILQPPKLPAAAALRRHVADSPHRKPARVPTTLHDEGPLILSLHWRDFEYLISQLYAEQGYNTTVTPRSKDRGKDVIAVRPGPNGEVVFVQCKNWRGRVDVDAVSALLGRVETERATRGVIVATSGFTRGPASATEFAEGENRMGLISGRELVAMLNEHLGRDWPQRLDRRIESERQTKQATARSTDETVPEHPPRPEG
jgi:predicted helicase